MRLLLTGLLVAVLASCPIVCGTVIAHVDHGGASGAPHPVNDDDCLCNGALKAGGKDSLAPLLALDRLDATVGAGWIAPACRRPALSVIATAPDPIAPRAAGGLCARLLC